MTPTTFAALAALLPSVEALTQRVLDEDWYQLSPAMRRRLVQRVSLASLPAALRQEP